MGSNNKNPIAKFIKISYDCQSVFFKRCFMKKMQKIALILAVLPLTLTACQTKPAIVGEPAVPVAVAQPAPENPRSSDTLIVFYEDYKKNEVLALFESLDAEVLYDYETMSGFAIQVEPSQLEVIKERLSKHPSIFGVNYSRTVQLH